MGVLGKAQEGEMAPFYDTTKNKGAPQSVRD
jgi:hypothetical protein